MRSTASARVDLLRLPLVISDMENMATVLQKPRENAALRRCDGLIVSAVKQCPLAYFSRGFCNEPRVQKKDIFPLFERPFPRGYKLA